MIKLKDLLNEIEYDAGGPLSWIGGTTYTWEHHHSIPFKASSLEVVHYDPYPQGGASWISYVYQGESPFALNVETGDGAESGVEPSKKSGFINKIVGLFKKELPNLLKMKKPIYPVISVITDNHWSDEHNRQVPTSINIYVGTDKTKDWALPARSTSNLGFGYDNPHPDRASNKITVYSVNGVKDKYPRPEYFSKELTEPQKKFIGDIVKTIWEKPNEGITSGKWVIRKTLYSPDEFGDPERAFPKADFKTKTDIGITDPRLKDGFWNMKQNKWGPYEEATKFSDREIKSINKQPYVIKTEDDWEAVLVSK